MKSSILTLILGLFLSTPVFAFRTLILEGDNRDFKCNYQNVLLKSMKNNSELVTSLNNLNFSPECLNPDQKRFIEKSHRSIKGFTFGMNGSLSKNLGLEGGMELVFTIYNRHTLMAGLVKYSGRRN